MSGTLYLTATPIGNLKDITLRALEILRAVDLVMCEDTRRSGLLLKAYEIKKPLESLHEHTPPEKQEYLLAKIKGGADAALISDAGTPLISDPGFPLVRRAIAEGIRVEAIPGPSAFVNALVVSGLPANEFTFAGYLPQKEKARRDKLEALKTCSQTLVFYESPYRLLKTLKGMFEVFGDRAVSVSREMTKKFEETVRGSLSEVIEKVGQKRVRGEFVIVVSRSVRMNGEKNLHARVNSPSKMMNRGLHDRT